MRIAQVLAAIFHIPFFVFSSSYAFSGLGPFTSYLFFVTNVFFWAANIPVSMKMAGRSGKPFITCMLIGIFAVLGVLHNGFGMMVDKKACHSHSHHALFCDANFFLMFLITIIALTQSGLFISCFIIARKSRYNPRFRFERLNDTDTLYSSVAHNSSSQQNLTFQYQPEPKRPLGSIPSFKAPVQRVDPRPVGAQPSFPVNQPMRGPSPSNDEYIPDDLPYDPRKTRQSL
ncbi:unnamed protein product [Moneuplotes crassus]|uniref:Uncharacterized protein n=1 Tax=Euplotes crassus TaxID=5936 RepID=A0AAD2D190_EUPCR|nr:unnamed protein product [Moneuplotes crassus]